MRAIRAWLAVAFAGPLAAFPAASQVAISGVQGLTAGDSHACLWSPLGLARCWGLNGDGLLGIGVAAPPQSLSEPQRISAAGDVVQVSAGAVHTCALRRDGSVACWGVNFDLQLGGATMDGTSPCPVVVPGLANVAGLAAGDYHTCALISDGTVRCWGAGGLGQLGNGTANSATPLPVTGISNAVQIAAGGNFSCARLASGAVSCWGQNNRGQLGRASSGMGDSSAAAAEVAGLGGAASDLDLGGSHACALVAGVARCWGNNGEGQLGDGGGSARHTPGDVIDTAGGSPVPLAAAAFSAGSRHSCAVRPSGALVCWGSGSDGRLGNGGDSNAPNPVAVTGFDGSSLAAVAVSAGGTFACARTAQGEVRCWGLNISRQLGDGTTTGSSVPVVVRTGQEAVSLTASATSATPGTLLTFTLVVNLEPFSLDDLPVARVTFYDGNTPISGCSDLMLAGNPPTVSCTTSALTAGTHEVSALYSGGAFSSETLAGPLRIRIATPVPTLRVHTFNFATQPPTFGNPLTNLFEDTRPFEPFLLLPSPITTHLLIADNMPVAFEQLTFTATSSNSALFDDGSFRLINGVYGGQKYKAVALRPKPNANGSATITYSVLGPGSSVLATTAVAMSVVAVNDPPAMIMVGKLGAGSPSTVSVLPAAAATGSVHLLTTDFSLIGTPADEAAQTFTPLLRVAASSSPSPITGNPTLQGSPTLAATPTPGLDMLSAVYQITASGAQGWVRLDGQVSDNGGGLCYPSGEGPNADSVGEAFVTDLLLFIFAGDRTLTYTTAINALSRPPSQLLGDGIQLFPAANFCSRTSRVYVVAGAAALIDANAQVKSVVRAQIAEVTGGNSPQAKALVSGESYLFSFRNAGTLPLAGVRIRIGQPAGVSTMSWTCKRGSGTPCPTASGNGALDMSLDLAIEETVLVTVDGAFDGTQGFVSLRGEAIYPPGVPAIRDGNQAITTVVASSGDGVFYGGFER